MILTFANHNVLIQAERAPKQFMSKSDITPINDNDCDIELLRLAYANAKIEDMIAELHEMSIKLEEELERFLIIKQIQEMNKGD